MFMNFIVGMFTCCLEFCFLWLCWLWMPHFLLHLTMAKKCMWIPPLLGKLLAVAIDLHVACFVNPFYFIVLSKKMDIISIWNAFNFLCLKCCLHHLSCFCFNKLLLAKRLLKFQWEILYMSSHLLTLYLFTEFHLYITVPRDTFKP